MKPRAWLPWLILAVLAGGVPIVIGTVRHKGLYDDAAATWVQAILAVVAILSGFWIALEQMNTAREDHMVEQANRDAAAKNAAVVLADTSMVFFDEVLDRLRERRDLYGEEIQRLKRRAEYQADILRRFPLESLKAVAAVTGFAPMASYLSAVGDVTLPIVGPKYGMGALSRERALPIQSGRHMEPVGNARPN